MKVLFLSFHSILKNFSISENEFDQSIGEHEILNGLGLEDSKRFILHYNFSNFNVGET